MSAESKEYISNVKASSEHLMHIVNNLLMFSFPEEDRILKEELPFSLSAVIQEISVLFEQKAKEKGIKFQTLVEDTSDDIVLGDPKLLSQILFNLFDNSIKFTLEGSVKSYFKLISESDRIYLEVKIIDTGIGISAHEINSIFDEFHQLDFDANRKFGGMGLGLYICKMLVQEQKGTINVSSKVGIGTVFELKIPYKASNREQQLIFADGYKNNIFENKTILVVDDDEYNRILANKRLEALGGHVVLCKNGIESLVKLGNQKFDIVLLDIHMPDISGVEVARIIRGQRNNINNTTPILAVTAAAKNEEHKNVFFEAGINDYLLKPYTESELIDKVLKLMNNSDKIESLKPNQIQPERDDIDVNELNNNAIYNLKELQAITKGDNEFLVIMLNIFLSNNKENLTLLEQSFTKKDFSRIGEIAHKMLYSYKQLKIEYVLNELEELETLIENNSMASTVIFNHIEKINSHSKRVFSDLEKEIVRFV